MEKLIDITSDLIAPFLEELLKDKSTKKNIIWATDSYQSLGEGFADTDEIKKIRLLQHTEVIKPRIQKSLEAQQARTRKRAEVFTPAWICNMMNNYCDEAWFGRDDIFNIENEDHTWTAREEAIEFPAQKYRKIPLWQRYVDLRRLEITCGEAPYLVSRYDVSTGELIYPLKRRIGLLDRKLRVVNEQTDTYEDWLKWTIRAFEACYGYEYQGDNVLLARINLFLTFIEYYQNRWKQAPPKKLLHDIIRCIAWNIWQMDGLNSTAPAGKIQPLFEDVSLFDMEPYFLNIPEREKVFCKIYDWRRDNSLFFNKLKEKLIMGKKLFDFVIGNPPYQEDSKGANESDTPVYHYFLDQSYKVANKVEMIHPARFLFNAGATPKAWNEKMLSDNHLKILAYEGNASKMFPNTSISGGVAITYRDEKKDFGAVGVFTAFAELNSILKKVERTTHKSLMDIMTNRGVYKYSNLAYKEQPIEMKKTSDKRIAPSSFERMPELFTPEKPNDNHKYIKIYGNLKNQRVFRWFREDYVNPVDNLYKYKVFISKADGAAGQIGKPVPARIIGRPVVMGPGIGCTETYITIGAMDTQGEADAIAKYIKTKFLRTMIGILKVTQNYAKPTWAKVPMQDFTNDSDIDWSKSIHEIDLQLYRKYGLDEKEIKFIEEHVKEMA